MPSKSQVDIKKSKMSRYGQYGNNSSSFIPNVHNGGYYNQAQQGQITRAVTTPLYGSANRMTDENGHQYVGLKNQAQTCCLNALIQSLYMTPEFRNAVFRWEYVGGTQEENKNIPFQLQKLFLLMHGSSEATLETRKLTASLGWKSTEAYEQRDVHELRRQIFEALEESWKNSTNNSKLISNLYGGRMQDFVKCLQCNAEKSLDVPFLALPLSVKRTGSQLAYKGIGEAVRDYLEAETLDGHNKCYCETCKEKTAAKKGMRITRFPYLLTVDLNRYDFNHRAQRREKINSRFTFPELLNLNGYATDPDTGLRMRDNKAKLPSERSQNSSSADFPLNSDSRESHELEKTIGGEFTESLAEKFMSQGPFVYELFSVVVHGGSAMGGHYYAYIKNFEQRSWFCFNDSTVKIASWHDIVQSFGGAAQGWPENATNAYMLIYRQYDLKKNQLFIKGNTLPHLCNLMNAMNQKEEKRNVASKSSNYEVANGGAVSYGRHGSEASRVGTAGTIEKNLIDLNETNAVQLKKELLNVPLSPLQQRYIEMCCRGRDIIVQAQPPEGRIIIYLIAILQQIDERNQNCQALIVTTSDAQTNKITDGLFPLSRQMNVCCHAYTEDLIDQSHQRPHPHIVIGTQKTIHIMLQQKPNRAKAINIIVMDFTREPQCMNQDGFMAIIYDIRKQLRENVQVMLFSGPISSAVMSSLQPLIVKNPIQTPENECSDNECFVLVDEERKLPTLVDMFLPASQVKQAIIFCNTQGKVNWLTKEMKTKYINVSSLSEEHMDCCEDRLLSFRLGNRRAIIATDKFSRDIAAEQDKSTWTGLAIISFDIPIDSVKYKQRVASWLGGRKSVAINFVTNDDKQYMKPSMPFSTIESMKRSIFNLLQ